MLLKWKDGTVVEVDLLHFYGCSFTAGEELLDYTNGQFTPEEQELKEKHLSWAAKLSNLLELPFDNHASAGNSMDNMRSQFYHDAMTGVIKPGHAVVIGTTGYFRETRFHPVTDDWEYGGYFQETKVLHPDDYGRAFGRVTSSWSSYHGDDDFAQKYLKEKPPYIFLYEYMNICRDMLYIAQKFDIPIFFVQVLEPISVDYFLDEYLLVHFGFVAPPHAKTKPKAKKTYEYLDSLRHMENEIHKYIIGEDTNASDEMLQSRGSRYGKVYAVMNDFCLKGTEDRLPGGHPKQHIHDNWAKFIAEKLKVEK